MTPLTTKWQPFIWPRDGTLILTTITQSIKQQAIKTNINYTRLILISKTSKVKKKKRAQKLKVTFLAQPPPPPTITGITGDHLWLSVVLAEVNKRKCMHLIMV